MRNVPVLVVPVVGKAPTWRTPDVELGVLNPGKRPVVGGDGKLGTTRGAVCAPAVVDASNMAIQARPKDGKAMRFTIHLLSAPSYWHDGYTSPREPRDAIEVSRSHMSQQ
jgi:hypothetical protein